MNGTLGVIAVVCAVALFAFVVAGQKLRAVFSITDAATKRYHLAFAGCLIVLGCMPLVLSAGLIWHSFGLNRSFPLVIMAGSILELVSGILLIFAARGIKGTTHE